MGAGADDSCFMGNDRQFTVQTNVGAPWIWNPKTCSE